MTYYTAHRVRVFIIAIICRAHRRGRTNGGDLAIIAIIELSLSLSPITERRSAAFYPYASRVPRFYRAKANIIVMPAITRANNCPKLQCGQNAGLQAF